MCSVCGKSFALQCNLRAHVKLHLQCKRPVDVAVKKEGVIAHNDVYPNPYAFDHRQSMYYNGVLNFGFGRMFPFNQKLVVRFEDNKVK